MANTFGEWITDEHGLPAFAYSVDQHLEPACRTFTTYGSSNDHFHQFGNTRLTVTAHNGGYVQVLDGDQGFLMLTRNQAPCDVFSGAGAAFLLGDGIVLSDLFTASSPPPGPARESFRRIFGANYFEKRLLACGVEMVHRITTPHGDNPAMISRITVTNASKTLKRFTLADYWAINPYYLGKSSVVTWQNRRLFGATPLLNLAGKALMFAQKLAGADTDTSRRRLARQIRCIPAHGKNGEWIGFRLAWAGRKPAASGTPASRPPGFRTVFLAPLNFHGDSRGFNRAFDGAAPGGTAAAAAAGAGAPANEKRCGKQAGGSGRALWWSKQVELPPGASATLICLFGYAGEEEIDSLVGRLRRRFTAGSWKDFEKEDALRLSANLVKLDLPEEPWAARESRWHSSCILGGFTRDSLFRAHKLPQGSVYLSGHGFDGAIRDYALFLPAVTALSPPLAREFLRYILSLMCADGSLPYGMHGYGAAIPVVHGKASDLHLSLLWAVTDYLYTTRDFSFLNESFPYYPRRGSAPAAGTVLERVEKAVDYIFSPQVGFGEHGLLKVNDGDWSDGITFLVKNRTRFVRRGESAYNSAMALYVLPRLLPLLKEKLPRLFPAVAEAIGRLEKAMESAWNGRWYYRGYDGGGRPVGDRELFLDHHTWYILSGRIPRERLEILLGQIDLLLDAPSPAGQLNLYPPLRSKWSVFPPGWDVNGGVWHAVNNLLTWACSRHDGGRAWRCAAKNSLAAREKAYPSIWYGIWTGPDSYNAHYASRPGEAFYHLPTPMCDYPAGNMNLYACSLLALLRLSGFEADFDGLVINTTALLQSLTLDSPLFRVSYSAESGSLSLTYRPAGGAPPSLIIKFTGPPRALTLQVEKVEGARWHFLAAGDNAASAGTRIFLEEIAPSGFTLVCNNGVRS